MTHEILFWGLAAVLALGSLGLVLAPLLRARDGTAPGAGRRASHDMQVFRDQLAEVEADRARGILSEAEAEATRVEVSRRLIAAADAEAVEPAPVAAGAGRSTAFIVLGLALAAAGTLYAAMGSPGMPDQPLAVRQAEEAARRAERPGQAEAEALAAAGLPPVGPDVSPQDAALIERMQAVMAGRPDDVEGQRLLARSLAGMGRWAEARAAQARVVAALGEAATGQDLVDAAELGILAAGGYVSPESEAALARALALVPNDPVARYYSAATLMQAGRADLALPIWRRLVSEGPAEAPWMAGARAGLAEAEQRTRRGAGGTAAGPVAEDVEAAGAMTPDERAAMIEGMVAQLGARLAAEGGPPEDWARLVRALGVLGRRDEAAEILAEARVKVGGAPGAAALLDAAAADAGLAP